MRNGEEPNRNWRWLWSIPVLLTLGVGAMTTMIAWPQISNCWDTWTTWSGSAAAGNDAATSCMSPNEIGDFLAGTFAPIAFVWLAFAVVLQSLELSAQREELKLGREVADKQRKALADQAQTMAETARLTKEQQARKDLDTLVQLVRQKAQVIARHSGRGYQDMNDHEYLIRYGKVVVASLKKLLSLSVLSQQEDKRSVDRARELKNEALTIMVSIREELGEFDLALYQQYGLDDLAEALEKVPDEPEQA